MIGRLPALLVLMLPIAALPAAAAEVAASSEIDQVTVFPSGAEITRIAKVKLVAGEHVIVIPNLPAQLFPDSVRVQGEASAKLDIGSVDAKRYFPPATADGLDDGNRKRLEGELEALLFQQTALQEAMQAAETQKALMINLANLPNRPDGSGSGSAFAGASQWSELFALIGQRVNEANKQLQGLRLELRKLEKQIGEVQRQLSTTPEAPREMTELRINVAAEAALDATLRVRYQIGEANWVPIYDVRLETGDNNEVPKLALSRRARVQQATGEDWSAVALTLSTTQPQQGTSAPELYPLVIDFEPEQKPVAMLRRRKAEADSKQDFGSADSAVMDELAAGEAAPEPTLSKPAAPVSQVAATVIDQGFQAVYVIAGRQTVKSGEGDKRVLIDAMGFEPVLTMRAVPKVNPIAYLYAKLKLADGVRLLNGQASLFRDGVFVGMADIPAISGGTEHELGFGADDLIRLKFATLERKTGETGLLSSSTTDDRQFKIEVKNLHKRAVNVRIIDQLPVPENEDIKVELSETSLKPTITGLDDKRGIVAWELALEPDQQTDILFGYQVSWPKDKKVVYQNGGYYPLQQ